MNSNLKLLPAALLVSVLALAACGGGGSSNDDMDMDDAMPEMTEAGKCAAKGDGYAIDGDGNCNKDAFNAGKRDGAAEEGQKRDKAADDQKKSDDRKAAEALAKALYGNLDGISQSIDTLAAGTLNSSGIYTVTLEKGDMVAAVAGWTGHDYDGDDDLTGRVYTIKGAAQEGAKFSAYAVASNGLTPITSGDQAGEYTVVSTDAAVQKRIEINAFTQTSGSHTFEKTRGLVTQAGSHYGVAGTYYCSGTDDCVAAVTGDGVQLTGTWTFKPTDADQRVTAMEGATYAFGWWENEKSFFPISFQPQGSDLTTNYVDYITTLRGTASYSGAAAGKYVFYRGSGAENEAGGFTAHAKLTAKFEPDGDDDGSDPDHSISGTLDNFTGADGKSRNWKVELGSLPLQTNGQTLSAAVSANTVTWTVDGTAADASGSWFGGMQGNHDGTGTPEAVTGKFRGEYNNIGRISGAFGATHE